MPQFDQFSFLNQVSYFFIFFLSFYFLITYFFLPNVCYTLKFRKKKISFDNQKTNQILFEKNNIIVFFNSSYQFFSNTFEQFLTSKVSIYQINQLEKKNVSPLLTVFLKNQLFFFLNQKFLILKKMINTSS